MTFLSSDRSNFTRWVSAVGSISLDAVSDVSVGPETEDLFVIYESVSIVLHVLLFRKSKKIMKNAKIF